MARPEGTSETPERIIAAQLHKAMKMQGRIQEASNQILKQYEAQLAAGTLNAKQYQEILDGLTSMTTSLSRMVDSGLKALKRDDSSKPTEGGISDEEMLRELTQS